MKASQERLLIVFVAAAVLLGIVFVAMSAVTERNRRVAVDRLKSSEVFQRHKPKARDQAASGKNGNESSAEQAPATDVQKERVAAFARLSERVEAFRNDPTWTAARNAASEHPEKWTDEEWALQKEPIERFHELVAEIRRLAKMGGPACVYDLSITGVTETIPHYAPFREMARLLYSDALVRGHEANYGEAVDDILAVLDLAGILRDEPTVIAQLVAIAVEGIGNGAAECALPTEGIPPEIARKVIEYDGLSNMRSKFADSFSGEGVVGLGEFEDLREGRDSGSFLMNAYGSVFARPWLNADEAAYADEVPRFAEIAHLPYYEALQRLPDLERSIKDLPFARLLSRHSLRSLMSLFASSLESEARNEASLDLMRVGLSIEQYRGTTGVFPPTLDAVSPMFGGRVPRDPFTGQPYLYQLSGDSLLLYSVGPNLTDDGGSTDRKTGDIVWRGQYKRGD